MNDKRREGSPDIVVFDLETTGLDVDEDRIVQFAAIKLRSAGPGFEVVDQMEFVCDPQMPIPREATEVHGIDDEHAALHAPFKLRAQLVLDFIGDADLCGHNMIAFDLAMLLAELKRCGLHMSLDGRRLFDTLEIFRVDVPHTLEGSLNHYCGESMGDEGHDAMADAEATAEVFFAQVANYECDYDDLSKLSIGNRVTLDGKIVRDEDGDACLSFGKHKGSKLRDVPKGFLRWMLGKDFSAETKAFVRRYV